MKDINLPPFYIGQKVVAIIDLIGKGEKREPVFYGAKGTEYTVSGIFKCCKWKINVSIYYPAGYTEMKCGGCNTVLCDFIVWCPADSFAPVKENFQSISLEKILEEETKLISVN